MARVLIRLLMGLVFVFVTMSSPVLAHAPHQKSSVAASHMDMASMDADCAKAMAAAHHEGDKGADCDLGCKCPLSHCPGTAIALLPDSFALIGHGRAALPDPAQDILPTSLVDTLKRPPRG